MRRLLLLLDLRLAALNWAHSRMHDESARKFDKAVAAWSKTTMLSFIRYMRMLWKSCVSFMVSVTSAKR